MRVRVLHLVVAGEIGGAERVVADLAMRREGQEPAAHAVAVLSPHPHLSDFFARQGIRVHDRGRCHEHVGAFLSRAFGQADLTWVQDVLDRESSEVIHVHTFGAHVLGTRAAEMMNIPLVRTEHSVRVYTNVWCWPWSRWSLRRSQRIIAVSQHVAKVARDRAPWMRHRLQVIHNGVDVPGVLGLPINRSPERFRFVLVGRLESRKGIDLALHALALVPDVALDIVGEGNQRAPLESLTARLGLRDRVKFHGYLQDPSPVVRAADSALSSSRQEGLSLALLEAMALGKPAVAVPVGGMVEFVIPGQTGWLADSTKTSALAAVMRQASLDSSKAQALGVSAQAWVRQRFSRTQMQQSYDEIYASVLFNRSPRQLLVRESQLGAT